MSTVQQKIYNKVVELGSPEKALHHEFLAEFGYQAMKEAKDRCFIGHQVLNKHGVIGLRPLNPPPADRRSSPFEEFYEEFSKFVIDSIQKDGSVAYRTVKRAFGGNAPKFYRAVDRFQHEHREDQPQVVYQRGVGQTRVWSFKSPISPETRAMAFLQQTLTTEPQLAQELFKLGAKEGLEEKTLRQAVRLVKNVSVVGSRKSEEWVIGPIPHSDASPQPKTPAKASRGAAKASR